MCPSPEQWEPEGPVHTVEWYLAVKRNEIQMNLSAKQKQAQGHREQT